MAPTPLLSRALRPCHTSQPGSQLNPVNPPIPFYSLSGGQYAPDHLAILNELVHLHQQHNRQQLAAPAQPPADAAGQQQARQQAQE